MRRAGAGEPDTAEHRLARDAEEHRTRSAHIEDLRSRDEAEWREALLRARRAGISVRRAGQVANTDYTKVWRLTRELQSGDRKASS